MPLLVKKEMMLDDLWMLFKKPLVTNKGLDAQQLDMVLAKSAWHYNSKQTKMKVTIIGQ